MNFAKDKFILLPSDDCSKISPDRMQCLGLLYNDNLNYHSIAEKLGIPVGTVKSRISRARTQIIEARLAHEKLYGNSP